MANKLHSHTIVLTAVISSAVISLKATMALAAEEVVQRLFSDDDDSDFSDIFDTGTIISTL